MHLTKFSNTRKTINRYIPGNEKELQVYTKDQK